MENKNKKREEEKPQPTESTEKGFESTTDGPAKEMIIKPTTSKDAQIPDANNKDEEKKTHKRKRIYKNKQNVADEQDSDGSANAFDGK